MGLAEIQREMMSFKEEIERVQMVPAINMIEMIDKWDKEFSELLDDSRAKFEQMLKDKRKEYELVVWKKPFMAWWLAQVDSELEKFKENQRLFKEHEAHLLSSNSNKWKIAKRMSLANESEQKVKMEQNWQKIVNETPKKFPKRTKW